MTDCSPATEAGVSGPPAASTETGGRLSDPGIEELLYIVSHDLKEPVRTMRSICSRLRELGLPDEASELVERMSCSCERMFGLVSSVLDAAAIEKRGASLGTVRLDAVIEEVLSDLQQLVADSGAVLNVSPLPEIEADGVQMRQLFQNLVSNSLKFGKPGQPINVAIGVSRYGWNRVEIAVRDDGSGMSPSRLAEIFGSGTGRTGRYGAGCGIGLLICRKIVEAHRGTIGIESEDGQGTTVTVALPVRQA